MTIDNESSEFQNPLDANRKMNSEDNASCSEHNMDVSDDTDARCAFDWKSKYPDEARKEIFWESVYVFILFFI